MSLLSYLSDKSVWIEYFEYKVKNEHLEGKQVKELFRFIRNEEYIPILDKILTTGFSIPTKKKIQKIGTTKKRVVYIFPKEENDLLKLLTYLLIRKYDSIFYSNLYSFRAGYGVKDAFKRILSIPNIENYFTYKVDISDYFNSIDLNILLPKLYELLKEDIELYNLIEKLLSNPYVEEESVIKEEIKGVMAGSPIAAFLANFYLREVDKSFENDIYCRYSDDIILFAKTQEELEEKKHKLLQLLEDHHLKINTSKEVITHPHEQWTFLGLKYDAGNIDISDVSVKKLKDKMRRKSRALIRWSRNKNLESINAVKSFINSFNKKLYNNTATHEMTWARWYFPLISTDKSLKIIDNYMQECIRYIATKKHTKSAYNFKYSKMKELGYQSLVNNWYKHKN